MTTFILIGVLAFLVLLFRQDHKEWPQFSAGLWIALFWLLITTTRITEFLSRGRRSYTDALDALAAYSEGNSLVRNISIVLIVLGLIVLYSRRSEAKALLKSQAWLLALYGYALVSIVWSSHPEVSAKRWIRITGSLIMALIVACEKEHHQAFEHLFRRYAGFCIALSVYLVRYNKGLGYVQSVHGHRFMAGVASHKNELGILCALALVFLVWRVLRARSLKNSFDLLLILLTLYLLSRAQSATSLVVAVMGLALLLAVTIIKGDVRRLVIISIIVAFVAISVLGITVNSPMSAISDIFYDAIGRSADMTGRVPLWTDVLKLAAGHIVPGAGYESYWLVNLVTLWELYSFGPTNAHNGYVDIIVNLGLIGLAILACFIIGTLLRLATGLNMVVPQGRILFIFFLMMLLHNMTETGLMNLSLDWLVMLMASAAAAKDRIAVPADLAGV